MKSLKEKLFFGIGGILAFCQIGLAVTYTLEGEITDSGGDPYLEVWFQYGKTPAYGYETPHQTLYANVRPGDPPVKFRASLSGLESCTTYYYRAVAKHQNYNDTTYGEQKSFTTECACALPTVDIKANGYDGSVTLPYNTQITLTWMASNASSCVASGDWSGTKSLSGTEYVGNLTSSKTYILTCSNSCGSTSDSVTVSPQQIGGAVSPTIQKKVRNASNGQTAFADSVEANPGEVIEVQIIINSGSGIQNARVRDILPEKMTFRSGSLKIDGVTVNQNIVNEVSLGNLGPNQTKTITFLVDLAGAESFSFGSTNLSNTATLYWDGNSISDSANVIVRKTGVLGAVTETPTGIEQAQFVFPLALVIFLSGILIFRSHFSLAYGWLEKEGEKLREILAKKSLERKIERLRKK